MAACGVQGSSQTEDDGVFVMQQVLLIIKRGNNLLILNTITVVDIHCIILKCF